MLLQLLTTFAVFACASGTALDDYVWRYDENYKWVDMVRNIFFYNSRYLIYALGS